MKYLLLSLVIIAGCHKPLQVPQAKPQKMFRVAGSSGAIYTATSVATAMEVCHFYREWQCTAY